MNNVGLYWEFVKLRLKSMVEYRSAFLWGAFAQFISYFAQFLLLWVLIEQFKTLAGWNAFEVLFLYAINLFSYALAGFFFFNFFYSLPNLIKTGEFDEYLIKPINPFAHLIFRLFNYGYFSHLALSIIVIAVAFNQLNLSLNFGTLLYLPLVLLGGALIHSSFFIFISVPVFWLTDNNGFAFLIFDFNDFIRYPVSIYNRGIQLMLTFVLPFAFVNFYPAQFFLKKTDLLGFHPYFVFLTPIVGVVLFWGAYRFWLLGISAYKSTGS